MTRRRGKRPKKPQPSALSPIRAALLRRFRDPENAATLCRLGTLFLDLVNRSGQHGSEDDGNTIRPALLAVAQDLLGDASNLTEITDEGRWNHG